MYTEEQTLVIQKFEELAGRLGSQNKACAQVGISPAIMSTLRKGIYTGDVAAQFKKLGDYFALKSSR